MRGRKPGRRSTTNRVASHIVPVSLVVGVPLAVCFDLQGSDEHTGLFRYTIKVPRVSGAESYQGKDRLDLPSSKHQETILLVFEEIRQVFVVDHSTPKNIQDSVFKYVSVDFKAELGRNLVMLPFVYFFSRWLRAMGFRQCTHK
jgi:hypothetical protein